ncbi:Collagen type IV alpha-3-binding protein [Eumeta japonica]|uniref:Collagen type IV alpha-3-binding protein n=1 Tax=Eumeta variegata TaxID=151549 RepID=A0A4C1XN10_EUMVA|nr:Collagen type IV alpha-3-binding protein [Eumeta japonica]
MLNNLEKDGQETQDIVYLERLNESRLTKQTYKARVCDRKVARVALETKLVACYRKKEQSFKHPKGHVCVKRLMNVSEAREMCKDRTVWEYEEGPHSTLPDDEFYDAVETSFDKMEVERSARAAPAERQRDRVDLPPPGVDNRITAHRLWPEIDRISTEQISAAFEGVGGEIGWQLFAEEGDMRMYRREMEVDGMVMDPLKAMHRVKGVSARELCHYFFNPRYRYDWETTLETMTIVEEVSPDAMIFHQTFKRVWPASQRDALFWSHVRAAPHHTYAVTNHSTTHVDYPANTGACIRLFVTVCLACRTTAPPGEAPTRDNITTSIAYCSTVNPGGWAPAGVLRAVYKREYPKFLKRFTQYVIDQCQDKPLAI